MPAQRAHYDLLSSSAADSDMMIYENVILGSGEQFRPMRSFLYIKKNTDYAIFTSCCGTIEQFRATEGTLNTKKKNDYVILADKVIYFIHLKQNKACNL